jgi:hypothetical protein
MAISSQYVALLRIGINSSPEWKEAWDRINDYLDALRTPEGLDRELILLSIFERAIARKRQEPFTPATELVFDETQKILDRSLGHLIDEKVPSHRRSIEQRVRLFLTETSNGSSFPEEDVLSGDILEALKEVKMQPSPRLQVASVTPRPFEFTAVGATIVSLSQWLSPVGSNRAIAWCIGLAIIGLLVFASR